MNNSIRKTLFRNTMTNYGVLVWRILTAILTTRFLYLGLGKVNYGFWALLWTIFGYSLLLDFGFSASIHKYTAEVENDGDYDKYNKYIAGVIASYLLMCIVVISITLCMVPFLDKIFTFSAVENIKYYKSVFVIFGVGAALVFPTGAFPEILVGFNRSDLKNYVLFGNVTAMFAGICILMKLNYSLMGLTIFSVIINLITNLIMVILVFKTLPGFKLSFKNVNWSYIKKLAKFSFFAYIYTISIIIIFRTDRMVLGIMLGMEAVAIYQIGTRISYMMEQFTTQFQKVLSPITHVLFEKKEYERLKWILLNSSRITAFVSTMVFVILIILSEPILYIWLDVQNKDAWIISCIMLSSVYVMVLFRSAFLKSLQLSGKHKMVALISSIESVANLLLSIILVKMIGIVGVAIGTFIPSFIISVFIFFPVAARFTRIKKKMFIFKVYIPVFLLAIPSVLFLLAGVHYIPLENWNIFILAAFGIGGAVIYLIIGSIFYITDQEKQKIADVLPMSHKIPFLKKYTQKTGA